MLMPKYAALSAALILAGCLHTQPAVKETDMNVIYPDSKERASKQGTYPIIILSHGAGGLGKSYFTWASHFRDMGFATMVLDHHTSRGYYGKTYSAKRGQFVSRNPQTNEGHELRLIDTPVAFSKIEKDPKIDKKRIWLAGWSAGAGFVYEGIGREGVLGGILFYPFSFACRVNIIDNKDKPIKVLFGEEDKGIEYCWGQYQNHKDYDWSIYENAYHSFDSPGFGTKKITRSYVNFTNSMAYSPEATAKAKVDITAFLRDNTPP